MVTLGKGTVALDAFGVDSNSAGHCERKESECLAEKGLRIAVVCLNTRDERKTSVSEKKSVVGRKSRAMSNADGR